MRDADEPGMSPRITVAMIEDWESAHGPIEAGEGSVPQWLTATPISNHFPKVGV